MLKSAKAKLDKLVSIQSRQLWEQKIYTICAAMKTLVYGVEMVSTTKHMQFQVSLNRAQQAATTWSDADGQKAIEQLELKIHHITLAKAKLFDKLFHCHERQLLQQVWTRATGLRSTFHTKLRIIQIASEDKGYALATDYNSRSPYAMLKEKPPPGASLIWSRSQTNWRDIFVASPRMNRSCSRRNLQST
jgi:uncharacterized protein (DUF736 family)